MPLVWSGKLLAEIVLAGQSAQSYPAESAQHSQQESIPFIDTFTREVGAERKTLRCLLVCPSQLRCHRT